MRLDESPRSVTKDDFGTFQVRPGGDTDVSIDSVTIVKGKTFHERNTLRSKFERMCVTKSMRRRTALAANANRKKGAIGDRIP